MRPAPEPTEGGGEHGWSGYLAAPERPAAVAAEAGRAGGASASASVPWRSERPAARPVARACARVTLDLASQCHGHGEILGAGSSTLATSRRKLRRDALQADADISEMVGLHASCQAAADMLTDIDVGAPDGECDMSDPPASAFELGETQVPDTQDPSASAPRPIDPGSPMAISDTLESGDERVVPQSHRSVQPAPCAVTTPCDESPTSPLLPRARWSQEHEPKAAGATASASPQVLGSLCRCGHGLAVFCGSAAGTSLERALRPAGQATSGAQAMETAVAAWVGPRRRIQLQDWTSSENSQSRSVSPAGAALSGAPQAPRAPVLRPTDDAGGERCNPRTARHFRRAFSRAGKPPSRALQLESRPAPNGTRPGRVRQQAAQPGVAAGPHRHGITPAPRTAQGAARTPSAMCSPDRRKDGRAQAVAPDPPIDPPSKLLIRVLAQRSAAGPSSEPAAGLAAQAPCSINTRRVASRPACEAGGSEASDSIESPGAQVRHVLIRSSGMQRSLCYCSRLLRIVQCHFAVRSGAAMSVAQHVARSPP